MVAPAVGLGSSRRLRLLRLPSRHHRFLVEHHRRRGHRDARMQRAAVAVTVTGQRGRRDHGRRRRGQRCGRQPDPDGRYLDDQPAEHPDELPYPLRNHPRRGRPVGHQRFGVGFWGYRAFLHHGDDRQNRGHLDHDRRRGNRYGRRVGQRRGRDQNAGRTLFRYLGVGGGAIAVRRVRRTDRYFQVCPRIRYDG